MLKWASSKRDKYFQRFSLKQLQFSKHPLLPRAMFGVQASMKFLLTFILFFSSGFACDYLSQAGCGESQRCIYVEKHDSPVCLDIFEKSYPLIIFPFGSTRVVTCDQGPHMSGENEHSHAWSNAMDALDLRTDDSEPAGKIYAGMSGRVAIYDECKSKNDQCGAGFGNQVKIFNSQGYLLFYSHLDRVYIKNGEEVKAGDLIGLEGNTGWTGKDNRHLHVSVHFGVFKLNGVRTAS